MIKFFPLSVVVILSLCFQVNFQVYGVSLPSGISPLAKLMHKSMSANVVACPAHVLLMTTLCRSSCLSFLREESMTSVSSLPYSKYTTWVMLMREDGVSYRASPEDVGLGMVAAEAPLLDFVRGWEIVVQLPVQSPTTPLKCVYAQVSGWSNELWKLCMIVPSTGPVASQVLGEQKRSRKIRRRISGSRRLDKEEPVSESKPNSSSLRVTCETLCDGGSHSATCGMKKFSCSHFREEHCSKGVCREDGCGSSRENPECENVLTYRESDLFLINKNIFNYILFYFIVFHLSWMLGNGAHILNGNIKMIQYLLRVFKNILKDEDDETILNIIEKAGEEVYHGMWDTVKEEPLPEMDDLYWIWLIAFTATKELGKASTYSGLRYSMRKENRNLNQDEQIVIPGDDGMANGIRDNMRSMEMIPFQGFEIGVEEEDDEIIKEEKIKPLPIGFTPKKEGRSKIPKLDLDQPIKKEEGEKSVVKIEEKKPLLKDLLPKGDEKIEIVDLTSDKKVVDIDKDEEAKKKLHKNLENLEKLATQQAVNQEFEKSSETLKIIKDMKKLVKNVKTQQKTLYTWIGRLKDRIVAERLQIMKEKFKAVRRGDKETAWGKVKALKDSKSFLILAEEQYEALIDHARAMQDAEFLLDLTNFREERKIMASKGEKLHDFRKWADLEKLKNRLARKAFATMLKEEKMEYTIGGLTYRIVGKKAVECITKEGREMSFKKYMKEKRKSKEKTIEVSLSKICLYCGSGFRTMKKHHKLCEECASHLKSGWKEEEKFLLHELDGNKNPISKTSGYEVLDGKKRKAGKRGTAPHYRKVSKKTRGMMKQCRTCSKEFEALKDFWFWCDTCRRNHNQSKIKAVPRTKKCEDCQVEIIVTNDKHTRCITCHKTWVTKNPRTGKKNYHNFKKVINWEEQNFDSAESQERLKKLGWVKSPRGGSGPSQ